MALFIPSLRFPIGMTAFASPAVFPVIHGIFRGVFMPRFTMGHFLTFFRTGDTTKSQTRQIKHFLFGKKFFALPSFQKSFSQSVVGNTRNIRPLCDSVRSPVVGNVDVCPTVILLSLFTSPLAVFRAIAAFVVNSFNRKILGRLSHISKKLLKTVKPFVTHSDAPATVIRERGSIGVSASLFNSAPNPVNFFFAKPMFGVKFMQNASAVFAFLCSKAPARDYLAAFKMVTPYFFFGTAQASTQKSNVFTANPMQNSQSSKNLINHDGVLFFSGHKSVPFKNTYKHINTELSNGI